MQSTGEWHNRWYMCHSVEPMQTPIGWYHWGERFAEGHHQRMSKWSLAWWQGHGCPLPCQFHNQCLSAAKADQRVLEVMNIHHTSGSSQFKVMLNDVSVLRSGSRSSWFSWPRISERATCPESMRGSAESVPSKSVSPHMSLSGLLRWSSIMTGASQCRESCEAPAIVSVAQIATSAWFM